MKYNNIKKATFLSRPNRFIALCEVDGKEEVCHVKNTGRCKELLVKGAVVYLQESDSQNRKTKYDVISVYKDKELINMDSQAPNKVLYEYIKQGKLFSDVTLIKPETTYKSSRFDLYVEHGDKKTFVEVKGVTLEENGVFMFPDAPTLRGVKHLNELVSAVRDGYEAYVVFVLQAKNAKLFKPNVKTHPEFAAALNNAYQNGVNVLCLKCDVTHDSLEICDSVPFEI